MRSKWFVYSLNPKRSSRQTYPSANSITGDKTVTQNTVPRSFICQLHDCSIDSKYMAPLIIRCCYLFYGIFYITAA